MKDLRRVDVLSHPTEFFRGLVESAIKNQGVNITPETEFYLVNLLVKYIQSEELNCSQEDPLAIKFHKALSAKREQSIQMLRDLGDLALYVSGIFADSLNRKIIDVDYYVAMGGAAYHTLSYSFREAVLRELYQDLCERFVTYTDILSEVSDQAFSHSNVDALRLYEKWLKTKSLRVAALLKEMGLFPLSDLPKTTQ